MITPTKKTTTPKEHPKKRIVKVPSKKSAVVHVKHEGGAEIVSKSVSKTTKPFLSSVGRRKSSVARIRLFSKGSGDIKINNQDCKSYFALPDYISTVEKPLVLLGLDKSVDIQVKVSGGGKAGQAIAVRHGISRALLLLDENYRKQLRPAGFLTRDARVKERKKPGLKKARRAPQFSKR